VCGFKSCRGLQQENDLEAQQDERESAKLEVPGSSPGRITNQTPIRSLFDKYCGDNPMTKFEHSLEELELDASKHLNVHFPEIHTLIRDTYQHLGKVFMSGLPDSEITQTSLASRVSGVLLVRLAADLRASHLVLQSGYPHSAATIASSIYEIAWTLAYIGANDDLAEKWVDHQNEEATFERRKIIVKAVLENQGYSGNELDEKLKIQEGIYKQLCMFKHGNSITQKLFGYKVIETDSEIEFKLEIAPDRSDRAIQLTHFVVYEIVRLVLMAVENFTWAHSPRELIDSFREQGHKIQSQNAESHTNFMQKHQSTN
jgi:hypothetical protein